MRRGLTRFDQRGARGMESDVDTGLQARAAGVGAARADNPLVQEVVGFIAADSSRSFTTPRE